MNRVRIEREFAIDPDVEAAIEALKTERDVLKRALEFIATYRPVDGYRAGYYALVWHARTTLTGELSPGRRKGTHAK